MDQQRKSNLPRKKIASILFISVKEVKHGGEKMADCHRCNGNGEWVCQPCGGKGQDTQGNQCHHCRGSEVVDCMNCSGTGHLEDYYS